MKTHQRNGFTLIELIVVIAILAILALLIVPQVTGYTKQSQAAVCKNNMATIIREYTYDYLMPDPDNPFVLKDHILPLRMISVRLAAQSHTRKTRSITS
jgi:prepilin-type N-terminal cleavage/methylation domain-containing protein